MGKSNEIPSFIAKAIDRADGYWICWDGDPKRPRDRQLQYTDPSFILGYDVDLSDFTDLIRKKQQFFRLSEFENQRYFLWILTMLAVMLEGPRMKKKTRLEKNQICEHVYPILAENLVKFDTTRGKSIFSYCYKAAYLESLKFFHFRDRAKRHDQSIQNHLDSCVEEYMSEISDCKI